MLPATQQPSTFALFAHGMKRLFMGLLLCGLSGWFSEAAALTPAETPPPADGILDDTRAIEPVTREILTAEFKKLSADLKCRLWLIAISFPPSGQNPRQVTRETRQHWSPQESAILLGYDRSDNRLGYSFSPDLWARYPAGLLTDLTRRTDQIIAREGLTIDEKISAAAFEFASSMRSLERVRLLQQRPFAAPERKLFFVLTPLLILGAAAAAWLGLISRRREQHGSLEYHLPDVAVGQRLGAPFGGGLIAECQIPRSAG